MNKSAETKKYMPLVGAAGIGSMLGSGIIIGLSATITVWQSGLGLTDGQVGILSGALTFAIAAGSLLAGNITKLFGLIRCGNLRTVRQLPGITCRSDHHRICFWSRSSDQPYCNLT